MLRHSGKAGETFTRALCSYLLQVASMRPQSMSQECPRKDADSPYFPLLTIIPGLGKAVLHRPGLCNTLFNLVSSICERRD